MFTFNQTTHPLAQTPTGETPPAKKRIATGLLPVAMTILLLLNGCGGSSDSTDTQTPATGRIVYVGKHNDLFGILTMNPDGTGHRLLSSKFYPIITRGLSFSPDGSKIVFVGTTDVNPGVLQSISEYRYNIWIMDSDGSNLRVLTDADVLTKDSLSSPSFSPDGTKLIFSRTKDGKHSVVIMNVADGTQTTIFEDKAYYSPLFTPDGSKIVVSKSHKNASGDLTYGFFTVNEDGTGETMLVGDADQLSFSRDGKRIAFYRDGEIYIANADGTGEKRLTNNNDSDGQPSFSPDGTRIVFNSSRDEPDASNGFFSRVFVMNVDGTNQTPIPAGSQAESPVATVDVPNDQISSHAAWAPLPAQ